MKRLCLNSCCFLAILALISIGCDNGSSAIDEEQKLPENTALFNVLPSHETNLNFINEIPENSAMNSMVYEYFYNGGGVAAGDINNDGLPDLYFVSNLKDNRLFINQGDLKFKDITEAAGVAGSFGWSTGVTMADVNADGFLDIYVSKSGKGKAKDRANELYINLGNETFREAAAEYGLDFKGYSTQASFFDYDKDGDLDMFLLNHNVTPVNTNTPDEFKTQYNEWVGDKLYRNDGSKFTDVTKSAGLINNPLGFGLGVSIGDLNLDGWPDIYVGNDYIEQDYLYLNNGNGTFSEQLKSTTNHTSNFSMGTDISDANNDGWPDIISLDMVAEDNYGIKTSMSGMNPAAFNYAVDKGFHYQYMYNAFQLNNGISGDESAGNPSFSEIAHLAGISNTDWSWAPLFADFDNDGWKDLFVSNGLKRDFRNNDFRKYKLERLEEAKSKGEKISKVIEELVEKTPQRKTSNYFFKNNQNLTFENKTSDWGAKLPSFSNGAVYTDLDADGDLDLVVNNIDEPAFVFKNNCRQNFIQFKFKGPKDNPFGVGTKIILKTEKGIQLAENYPTRGYQSAMEPILHFGLGEMSEVKEAIIIWNDGSRQKIELINANQRLNIQYEKAVKSPVSLMTDVSGPNFSNITTQSGINHLHKENQFDDFEKESLLPYKRSQLGPALAVGDVNGDKLEDFFIGGAKDQAAELYFQNSDGSFSPSQSPLWQREKRFEDVDAVFFDADSDGDLDLYVVSGGNEFDETSPFLQDRLYLNDGEKQFIKNKKLLPKMLTSGACVRPCDYDEDGDIDLFVGGRLIPGKYPFPARSYLLENDGGLFKDVTAEIAPELEKPGMVTDAIWTDYNNDQQLDLVVVGEWMPVSFFENKNSRFEKNPVEIESFDGEPTGWWWSVAGSDFDGDGDTDYMVGNLGLNYKYKASTSEPFEVYCHDFDGNGSQDIVLGYYNKGTLFPLRGRECSSNQMPFLKEKFPTYHEFGSADLMEIYGEENLENALHLTANTFATIWLENKGNGKFQYRELPKQAQFSSVNGILVNDWNGDGQKQIIVAGNLFQSEVETPRNDAGIGLELNFDQEKGFYPVASTKNGLYLEGDVKKMSMIQIGPDSRSAILTARNNDYLQLVVFDKKIQSIQ